MAGQSTTMQRRLEVMTEEVERLHETVTQQRVALAEAERQRDAERHRLTTSLLEKGNEVAVLVAENEKLHTLYRTTRVQLEGVQREADRLALAVRHQDDTATGARSTLTELQARYEEVCALVADLHTDVDRRKGEAASLADELYRAKRREEELVAQVNDMISGATSMSGRVRQASSDVEAVRLDNARLTAAVEAAEKEAAVTRGELSALRDTFDAMLARYQDQVMELTRRVHDGEAARTARSALAAAVSAASTGVASTPPATSAGSRLPSPSPTTTLSHRMASPMRANALTVSWMADAATRRVAGGGGTSSPATPAFGGVGHDLGLTAVDKGEPRPTGPTWDEVHEARYQARSAMEGADRLRRELEAAVTRAEAADATTADLRNQVTEARIASERHATEARLLGEEVGRLRDAVSHRQGEVEAAARVEDALRSEVADLRSQVASLQTVVRDHKDTATAAVAQAEAMGAAVAEGERKLAGAVAEAAAAGKARDELAERLADAQLVVGERDGTIASLRRQLSDAMSDATAHARREGEWERRVATVTAQLSDCQSRCDALQAQLHSAQVESKEAHDEIRTLRDSLAAVRAEAHEVNSDVGSLHHQLEVARADAHGARADLDAMRHHVEAGRAELEALHRQLEAANADAHAARREVTALHRQLAAAQAEAGGLQRQVEVARSEADEVRGQAHALRHQLESVRVEGDALRRQVEVARTEAQEARSRNEALHHELEGTRSGAHASHSHAEVLHRQLTAAQADCDALRRELDDVRTEARAQLDDSHAQCRAARGEVDRLRAEVAAARAEAADALARAARAELPASTRDLGLKRTLSPVAGGGTSFASTSAPGSWLPPASASLMPPTPTRPVATHTNGYGSRLNESMVSAYSLPESVAQANPPHTHAAPPAPPPPMSPPPATTLAAATPVVSMTTELHDTKMRLMRSETERRLLQMAMKEKGSDPARPAGNRTSARPATAGGMRHTASTPAMTPTAATVDGASMGPHTTPVRSRSPPTIPAPAATVPPAARGKQTSTPPTPPPSRTDLTGATDGGGMVSGHGGSLHYSASSPMSKGEAGAAGRAWVSLRGGGAFSMPRPLSDIAEVDTEGDGASRRAAVPAGGGQVGRGAWAMPQRRGDAEIDDGATTSTGGYEETITLDRITSTMDVLTQGPMAFPPAPGPADGVPKGAHASRLGANVASRHAPAISSGTSTPAQSHPSPSPAPPAQPHLPRSTTSLPSKGGKVGELGSPPVADMVSALRQDLEAARAKLKAAASTRW